MIGLDDYLSSDGTDVTALVASVEGVAGLAPGDILLAVGSLAEGLGTHKSDLDLLLIADGERQACGGEEETAWTLGRCIVDLRVVRSAEVVELIGRLRRWAGLPWNVSQAARFTPDERVLLHRLLHGRQLFPADAGGTAAEFRPPRCELARLKLQVARHMARTIQVDMAGYRDNRDPRSLVFAAQDLLGHAVDGLLAGHHVTSFAAKWRSRLLDSLPVDWEGPLAVRPSGLTAGRRVWDLHLAPAEPDEDSALEHALRCASFARAVFAWAEPRLVESTARPPMRHAWSASERCPAEPPLPSLELDVDFFLTDGRAAVARLNEFGRALEVSDRELALLLLCDGSTTAGEAEQALNGCRDGGAEKVDVGRVVRRALEAGLFIAPRAATQVQTRRGHGQRGAR